ncbi:hypothetical protein K9M48_02845 [Candidatus Gracilibacteria bacterium]|nr:hypothetical protein [Candidatus Gracilibacteria bacterium]
MKFFSNFDTNLKKNVLGEYQERYGKNMVLLLQKSRLFWYLKFFIPLMFYLILFVGSIIASYYIFGEDSKNYIIYVVIGVFLVILTFIGPVIKHIVDYYMDFAVITPNSLVMYNQTGFFKRDVSIIDVDKVKTILVRKRSAMYSIFNNGDLIFLSEGDSNNFGEVILYFIARPERNKKEIMRIVDKFKI